MVSITRTNELRVWDSLGGWKLIYGRRKTGKTYFVRNFVDFDEYFLVGRDGTIYGEGSTITYDALVEIIRRGQGKRIVVDEFHRLNPCFQDLLQSIKKDVEIVIMTSTLNLSKRIIGQGSPILGLFAPIQFSLIDERDVLRSIAGKSTKPEVVIESATYMREPWVIPFFDKFRGRDDIYSMAKGIRVSVPALIGEIFSEEHRSLATTYDAILRAIASGNVKSTEIADSLYSHGVIKRDDPSAIQPHLNVLISLGVIERIPIVPGGRKRFIYRHVSPVVDMFYYLDEKYMYTERDVGDGEVQAMVDNLVPRHVEAFFRNLYASIHGGRPAVIYQKGREIDIGIIRFQKVVFAAEVKWKNHITSKELGEIESKLQRFEDCMLIVKSEGSLPRTPKIPYVTASDALSLMDESTL